MSKTRFSLSVISIMGYIDVEIWAAKAFYIGARVQPRDFEIT